ncbi:hypothetical protein [Streptomyces sp. NPDC046925]|uniref:hypothetical protein n=1 Tax=Streptomyces sp. NPDC046925 TaxID=3155375 RepID=UPI0033EB1455
MNITKLLADLQAQHDETAARTGGLRHRITHLTGALTETQARLADLATTRKVITELAPAAGSESQPPETNTAYQAIVNAFNHSAKASPQPARTRPLPETDLTPSHAVGWVRAPRAEKVFSLRQRHTAGQRADPASEGEGDEYVHHGDASGYVTPLSRCAVRRTSV